MSVDNQITLHCYRLTNRDPYDPETVWAWVQAHGGQISIGVAGDYDFLVPEQHRVFFILKFAGLRYYQDRSYI